MGTREAKPAIIDGKASPASLAPFCCSFRIQFVLKPDDLASLGTLALPLLITYPFLIQS